MEPNCTLRDIADRLSDGVKLDDTELLDMVLGLKHWLQRGGFEPDWNAFPEARDYYQQVCTRPPKRTSRPSRTRVELNKRVFKDRRPPGQNSAESP